METPQASLTAENIAAARAIESSGAESVRVLYDPFARCFLSKPRIRSLVWSAGLVGTPDAINSVADRILGPPGLMMSFCYRARCIDDTLSAALTAGCIQAPDIKGRRNLCKAVAQAVFSIFLCMWLPFALVTGSVSRTKIFISQEF
jgi:hypothetical protein